MSSFFKRFARGTSSSNRRPTKEGRPIPEPQAEERPQRTVTKPKPAEEAAQAEDDEVDNKLVKPEPTVRAQRKKETPKATEGQETDGYKTTTNAEMDAENIYHLAWREEESYRLIPERNPRINEYTPNAIALFRLLEAAEDRINYSKHIQVHEPNYVPYAVKCYYAIMFYMQILEARKAAGEASGFEMSLLKRFHAKYSRDSLPCAEIVYAYFNTIAATELADVKYDWIAPRVGFPDADGNTTMFHENTHSTNPDDGSIYMQPQIPYMIAILNSFIKQTNVQGHMTNGELYTPGTVLTPPVANNHRAFGFTWDTTAAGNAALLNNKCIFAANGVNTPMRFGNGNYSQAQNFARRSDFARNIGIVVSLSNIDLTGKPAVETIDMSTLDQFLFMEKTSNLKWFGYLREQAVIHARFFDTVYHFSDVQATAGLETAIICRMKADLDTPGANGYYHNAVRLGLSDNATHNVPTWYNNVFHDITGSFATNRSGIKRNEELQALTYGTNATLPIRTANNVPPIGSLVDTNNAQHGHLWNNQEWIRSLYWPHNIPGKPMFSGMNSVVLRCYREKPHGTGVVDNQFD